jgi:hypothetical protein
MRWSLFLPHIVPLRRLYGEIKHLLRLLERDHIEY